MCAYCFIQRARNIQRGSVHDRLRMRVTSRRWGMYKEKRRFASRAEVITSTRRRLQSGLQEYRIEIDSRSIVATACELRPTAMIEKKIKGRTCTEKTECGRRQDGAKKREEGETELY